jgi:hypothetical protein
MMVCSNQNAPQLCNTLIHNFVTHTEVDRASAASPDAHVGGSGSLVVGLTSKRAHARLHMCMTDTMLSALSWLNESDASPSSGGDDRSLVHTCAHTDASLSNLSLLLLVCLCCHSVPLSHDNDLEAQLSSSDNNEAENVYRRALATFTNAQGYNLTRACVYALVCAYRDSLARSRSHECISVCVRL